MKKAVVLLVLLCTTLALAEWHVDVQTDLLTETKEWIHIYTTAVAWDYSKSKNPYWRYC